MPYSSPYINLRKNKTSGKKPESGFKPDAEESSTIRTIRTQRFLIKWLLLSFKKGNDFKKEASAFFFEGKPFGE